MSIPNINSNNFMNINQTISEKVKEPLSSDSFQLSKDDIARIKKTLYDITRPEYMQKYRGPELIRINNELNEIHILFSRDNQRTINGVRRNCLMIYRIGWQESFDGRMQSQNYSTTQQQHAAMTEVWNILKQIVKEDGDVLWVDTILTKSLQEALLQPDRGFIQHQTWTNSVYWMSPS